jgi:hypothetical protein
VAQLHFDEVWGEQNRAKLRVVGLYKAMNRIKGMALADATQKEALVKTYEYEFVRAFEDAALLAPEGSNLSAQLDALEDAYNHITRGE